MARKNGLNQKDIVQCVKWQNEGVPIDLIAKKLKTSPAVIKRFTPEKVKEAAGRASKRASLYAKKKQDNVEKAAVLTQALGDLKTEDDGESDEFE